MTTGAMIVGIIGGVVGLIVGIIAWTIASFLGALLTFFHIDGSGIALLGFLVLALSVVGLVGGALAKAKPLAAGILMLIGGAGGFPLVGWFWLFPGILLIIGGILAIVGHMGEPKPVEIGAKAVMVTGSSHPRARAIPHQPNYRGIDAGDRVSVCDRSEPRWHCRRTIWTLCLCNEQRDKQSRFWLRH